VSRASRVGRDRTLRVGVRGRRGPRRPSQRARCGMKDIATTHYCRAGRGRTRATRDRSYPRVVIAGQPCCPREQAGGVAELAPLTGAITRPASPFAAVAWPAGQGGRNRFLRERVPAPLAFHYVTLKGVASMSGRLPPMLACKV